MNTSIVKKEVQEYIRNNQNVAPTALAFSKNPFPDIPMQEILQQVAGMQKAKNKLPTWFCTENIFYPPKINLEQTSSEITAKYKASLVTGYSLADLTGGFGVDSYFFSKKIKNVQHYETNKELSAIAAHNFKQLGAAITCITEDGITAIAKQPADVIYLDPSRRSSKGKVFFLEDSEPNVVKHLSLLQNNCQTLLIKTSPMLDIQAGLEALKNVTSVHVVAVENEVKELLWLFEKNNTAPLQIHTVNFKKNTKETFAYVPKTEVKASYSFPKTYLYEPNTAILKSGAFTAISAQYEVDKLEKNTHLYTSTEKIDFPGRRFQIVEVTPYTQKAALKKYGKTKANITIRNFPQSVNSLRKKLKIADGGSNYLFFTTLQDGQKVILRGTKI